MNRCVFAALLGATMLVAQAQAQTLRPFPATALRGELSFGQPPLVELNGQPARLSPGARIRGENNLLVLSGALVGQTRLVHYTLETNGLVHDVWLLTPEERARQPWPTSAEQARRWSYDPGARAWTAR